MAAKMTSSSSLSIGNCKVEIQGDKITYSTSNPNDVQISVPDGAKIRITTSMKTASKRYNTRSCSKAKGGGEGEGYYSFVVVNPKDTDTRTKFLLQEILKIYRKELPTMSYAANTGKESLFLERCISSGKYCTLLLTSNSTEECGKVIAAVTYQIIPVDTQYAEVPLAAVCSNYQHKGIGRLLYSELRERLLNVGTQTIFCWGDKESEDFWVKQGFIPIAEIDTKGKARRIPIKADIRRALCFPGGSTLMVSHLNKDSSILRKSSNQFPCLPLKAHANPSLPVSHELGAKGESYDISKSSSTKEGALPNRIIPPTENTHTQLLVKDRCSPYDEKFKDSPPKCGTTHDCGELAPSKAINCNNIDNSLGATDGRYDNDGNPCSCSLELKRKRWEVSCSSIKSKKLKGAHHSNCHLDSSCDLQSKQDQENSSCFGACSLATSNDKSYVEAVPESTLNNTCLAVHTEVNKPVHVVAKDCHIPDNSPSEREQHRIMLMDIADDSKKAFLTKIIQELGGVVTSDGSISTHVITGKVRRTLNFCTALCSGAWILSTNWLKESFRNSRFLNESSYLLEDKDYVLKYKTELKDAVMRAKSYPRSLLKGYHMFLAKHVQPTDQILSAIVKSAGGNVLQRLDKVLEPSRTIFIACEEDTEEAMLAARRGLRTYSSDWLMSCLMTQELDLQAPQFVESL